MSLIGGRARQQPVPGAPHFAHTALPQSFHQVIASQLARATDLGAQRVDHAGADVGHHDHEQIGEHEPEEEFQRAQLNAAGPAAIANPITTGTALTEPARPPTRGAASLARRP